MKYCLIGLGVCAMYALAALLLPLWLPVILFYKVGKFWDEYEYPVTYAKEDDNEQLS